MQKNPPNGNPSALLLTESDQGRVAAREQSSKVDVLTKLLSSKECVLWASTEQGHRFSSITDVNLQSLVYY